MKHAADAHQPPRTSNEQEAPRRRLHFDPTINAGHVLTFLAMAAAVVTSWSMLDKRITVVEQEQVFQRERDKYQDESVGSKFTDIKDALQKIDRNVETLRNDQLKTRRP